jgi:hypothetical protein
MSMPHEPSAEAVRRWSLLGFGGAILLGAFLLFQVQPLVSKAILPWFGGCPAVWTTCMLFFQTLLFAGYLYAHLLQRSLAARHQAAVHLALVVVAALVLPIVPGPEWKPAEASNPTLQILVLLAATVGMPYFVLSATSPLVQSWFSRALPGRSPYRLYALSNVGSLAALLTYPVVFEPALDVPRQSLIWSVGFVVYAVLCAAALPIVWAAHGWSSVADPPVDRKAGAISPHPSPLPMGEGTKRNPSPLPRGEGTDERPAWSDRLCWMGLPALASLMLLAATNHVCQDVAVVPLLWVVPLALYLLSFIICFDHARWYVRPAWAVAAATALIAALMNDYALELNHALGPVAQLAIYFAALFFTCMVCHGEVAGRKPAPRYLTEFYLLVALGGSLGGVLVAIVAPLLFSSYLEWHIGLNASLSLCLGILMLRGFRRRLLRWTLRVAFACFVGVAVLDVALWSLRTIRSIDSVRNFFGVMLVQRDWKNPEIVQLRSGRISHGRQSRDLVKRYFPTAYYGKSSGVGRAILQLQKAGPVRVGVVGLGVGTLAAYARPGDQFRFYEINPAVVRFAEQYFTYLSDCRGTPHVVMGDARVSLERQWASGEPQRFDLLVVDAFSGDAVPTHLLTAEAMAVYEHHLAPNGVIAFHISNKYLRLAPVVRSLAEHAGMQAVWICDEPVGKQDRELCSASDWMLLTRNVEFLRAIPARPPLGAEANSFLTVPLWTDQYSNLFQILRHPE